MTQKSRYCYSEDEKQKLLEQAWGYSTLDMHKEAVGACEKLVKLDSNNPSSYIELGFYYEQNGEIDEAVQCYRSVMNRFPEYYGSYTNMGHYFQAYKERCDIAMVCYEKALELYPDDKWALNNIGTILQEDGMWQDALVYYEKAYNASNKDEEEDYNILHNLAWAYHRCKRYKDAWQFFNELVKRDLNIASVYSDFGCVNYKMGLYGSALSLFKKALSMYPSSKYYEKLYKITSRKVMGKKGLF